MRRLAYWLVVLVVVMTYPYLFQEGICLGQLRTSVFGFPLYNVGDTLRAGIRGDALLSDTSVNNTGVNGISNRAEKFFNQYFSRQANDSLRNIGYIRFNNGNRFSGTATTAGTYFYGDYLYIVPSTSIGQIFYPYGTSAGNTSALVFNELAANGSNYVGFKAPDNISSNKIWTLPSADGTNGQALVTNGSGVLSFASVSGTGTDTTSLSNRIKQRVSSVTGVSPVIVSGDTARSVSVDTTRRNGTSVVTYSQMIDQHYVSANVASGGGKFPNTGASSGTGDVSWTNASNATGDTSASSYAAVSLTTGQRSTFLTLTNFKILIPWDATVTGITARVARYYASSGGGTIKDTMVYLVKGGSVTGTAKKNTSVWATSEEKVSYGGATDLWGATLTAGDVMSSTFGVALVCKDAISGGAIGYVNWIALHVYYSSGGKYSSYVAIKSTGQESGVDTMAFSVSKSDGTVMATIDTNGNVRGKFGYFSDGVTSGNLVTISNSTGKGLKIFRGVGDVLNGVDFFIDDSRVRLYQNEGDYTLHYLGADGDSLIFPAGVNGTLAVTNNNSKTNGYLAYWSDNLLRDTAITSLGLITPADTTTQRTYSNSLYATISNLALKAPLASPTFTGTVTLPTGLTGRLYATAGVVSTVPSDTVGLGASLFGKVNTGTDSAISKAGSWFALAAVDSFYVYRVPCNGLTLSAINCIRVGGTSASVNVTRTRAGSTVDLLTANYASTTSMASAGTVQNTTLQNGDVIRFCARAVSGTVTELFVQIDMTRSK